jgi:hypothetical protein
VLRPAEADWFRAVLDAASTTLGVDDALPADRRAWQRTLASRLDQAAGALHRRVHRAERASVRLDAGVHLDPGEGVHALFLLREAAATLDGLADHRERGPHLVGTGSFRQQASAVRAWRADLGGLAARQADRRHPARAEREDARDR